MQHDLFKQYNFKFFSLGSGSSGNCYYLGTPTYGMLIDVGIGARNIAKTLREFGIAMEHIHAILLTHDHADHVKSIGMIGRKLKIPVYTTAAVHDAIARNRYLNINLGADRHDVEKDVPFQVRDFKITAFDVPHDSSDNVGYHIVCGDEVFVLATDIGCVTDTMATYVRDATQLVVETNYDDTMLQNGRYPAYLKQRISNGRGHISNRAMADFLEMVYTNRLKNIWLCHLSQDNNLPELAYETVKLAIERSGAKVDENIRLQVLNRHKPSGLREF